MEELWLNLRRRPRPERPHLTVAERTAVGKAARAATPRRSHGGWSPAPDRADPITLLEEQAATRVPELVPIRYGRMLTSPFAFFRGGAYLMAADLAAAPTSGLTTQLCGDAHLSNFGGFAAPDRRLVFSINDFDETLPGPFDWDLKRLAASFAVVARESHIDEDERRAIVQAVSREYRTAMAAFASMSSLDVWYARLDIDRMAERWAGRLNVKERRRFQAAIAKARTRDSLRAFAKLTTVVDGKPRIARDEPLILPVEDYVPEEHHHHIAPAAESILRAYRRTLPRDRRRVLERYRYVHAARKVVGVGSVGTRAWIMLLLGRDGNDPLFLQFKEAQRSVLEPFLGASGVAQHGQRVVEGQRLMQAASDILLGWERVSGMDGVARDFYVRQLWDAKASIVVEALDAPMLAVYGEVCAWTLARAHARSGDPVAISTYLGKSDAFDRALAAFAEDYADQNERDYAALREAVASGRVVAVHGL